MLDTAGVERPDKTTKSASKPYGGKTPAERKAAMQSSKPAQREDATCKAVIRVVDSLADKLKHIPYRDSKLTRLLASALGGGGRGSVLGCLSSAKSAHAESEAMLQFLHKCATAVSSLPTPFKMNPPVLLEGAEAEAALLAAMLGVTSDPDQAKALKPSQIECTMESPPEMADLRDLLARMELLRRDPIAELLAEQ